MTLPKDFPKNEELEYEFFRANFNYIKKLFGEENIISATVHRDEAQDHIHINILPIVEKTKTYKDGSTKERVAFDAKNLINRNFLKSFHKEVGDYLEDWLGFRPNIENGATKAGNKTIEELKIISEAEERMHKIMSEKSVNRLQAELIKKEYKEQAQKRKLNNYWQEYIEYSNYYWKKYKLEKQKINENLWELKKEIKGTEKQLQDSLDFVGNLSRGLFYAIFKLIEGLILLENKVSLEADQERLERSFEELNKSRQSISNYQHNTKEALKKEDFERIEKNLENWENAINAAHQNILIAIEDKPKEKEKKRLFTDFER